MHEGIQTTAEGADLFRGLFLAAPDPMGILDDEGRVLDLNPAACALLGRSREELIGRSVELLGRELGGADVGARFSELLETGEVRGELGISTSAGERFLEYIARARFVPGCHLVVLRDVTDRVRDADERERLIADLAEERSWLDALVERSPVAIVLTTRSGSLRINRRARELLGASRSAATPEEVGRRLCDGDSRPIPLEQMPLLRAMRGETVQAEEIGVCRADGRRSTALVSAAPIRSASGEYLGAVALLEDLTALKEQERLRVEWTSVVAHDLRQPVTVIDTQAQLLARRLGQLSAEQIRAKIEHIRAGTRQLTRMISDLLDASRVEASRVVLDRTPVDLETFVRTVVERLAPELGDHPVQLRVEPGLPPALVDPVRLEQILGNLLSNAVKYGAKKAPIAIEVKKQGRMLALSVSNRGKGIAPAELPSLFSRFHRSREAQEGRVAGLGLGLYITRGLVEAHGGTISAESIPGGTTTFRFTLPAAP